jgi:hypothetical protein
VVILEMRVMQGGVVYWMAHGLGLYSLVCLSTVTYPGPRVDLARRKAVGRRHVYMGNL